MRQFAAALSTCEQARNRRATAINLQETYFHTQLTAGSSKEIKVNDSTK
jgi:hypothetical protein